MLYDLSVMIIFLHYVFWLVLPKVYNFFAESSSILKFFLSFAIIFKHVFPIDPVDPNIAILVTIKFYQIN